MGALLPTSAGGPLAGRQPLTFEGQRVLTTELAARAFGADEKLLTNNFERNRARFEEGKHFHKVEGAELRSLKDSPSFRGSVGVNARSLTLWTERGVARHAKILETDTAWEIFEALEDTYFRVREEARAERTAGPPVETSAREIRLMHKHALAIAKAAGLAGNQLLIAANRVTKRGTGFDVLAEMGITHLVAPVNDPLVIPTKLGQDLGGLTPREVNKLLARLGYQWADKDHRDRNLWRPTPKGEALGAQLMDRERSNDTGAAQQLMWPLAATLEVLRAGLRDDAGDDGEAA